VTSKRSYAAICREIQMVKSVVTDEVVRGRLVAELERELAVLAGVSISDIRQGALELTPPVSSVSSSKK